jgi:hypothetical protein
MANLKGFTTFGDSTVTNDVRQNLISFFDYGLIEKSGFINVEIPTTGYYGGSDHQLRLVDDPRYTTGQVWEGFRSNWVWESGVGALTSVNPAYPGVSGVYVNGDFYPTSTAGDYAHHINHPLGRIVFDSPISTTSTVTCEYSYKYVNVTEVDGLNWFKQVQQKSERSDSSNFINNSGEWGILADNRYQLPAIGIEVVNARKMTPHAIGGGQNVFTDLLFHCVAEDVYTRDHLIDIVSLQNEKVFYSYNLDTIASSGAFPLDYRGVPVSGALQYPDLINQHQSSKIRLINSSFDSVYSLTPNIHVGTVKVTTELILFGV